MPKKSRTPKQPASSTDGPLILQSKLTPSAPRFGNALAMQAEENQTKGETPRGRSGRNRTGAPEAAEDAEQAPGGLGAPTAGGTPADAGESPAEDADAGGAELAEGEKDEMTRILPASSEFEGKRVDILDGEIPINEFLRFLADYTGLPVLVQAGKGAAQNRRFE